MHWLWGLPLALGFTAAFALGFGEIKLDSALNQPLQANVPLYSVKPAERDTVTVRVASPETFRRFGIARPAVLDDIQIEVVPGSDPSRMNVVMRSRRVIREPFLTFLLEAEWPQGRALREYTVLLDPPVTPATVASRQTPPPAPAAAAPPASAAPAPAPQPAVAARPTVSSPAPAPEPARAAASARPTQASTPSPAARPTQQSAPAPAAPAAPASAPAEAAADGGALTQTLPDNEATEGFAGKYGPVKAGESLSQIASELRPAADITMNQLLLALYRANPDAFDGNMNRIRRGAILFVPTEQEFRSVDRSAATAAVASQNRALRAPAAMQTADAGEPADSSPAAPSSSGGELQLAPAPEVMDEDSLAADAAEDSAEDSLAAGADDASEQASAPAGPDAAPDVSVADESGTQASADTPTAADATNAEPEEQTELSSENMLEPDELETLNADDDAAGTLDAVDEAAALDTGETAVTDPAQDSFPWALLLLLLAAVSFCIAIVLFLRNRSQYKPVDFSTVTPAAATGGAATALGSAYGRDADEDEAQADDSAEDNLRVQDAGDGVLVDDALRAADRELASGNWEDAAATLRSALDDHPGEPLLQRRLMEALHAGGARDEFLDEVDNAYAGVPDNDPNWQAVAVMGRELAPGDPRFDTVPDPDGEDVTTRPGESEGVHELDPQATSEFDMSDFDDSTDADYPADEPRDEGIDVSDFEIADSELDGDSTEREKSVHDAAADETASTPEEDFDLGNDALDFEFTDSSEFEDKAADDKPAADDSSTANTGASAAADGLSISQMDDLSFTDDEEADAEGDDDDVSIKLDLARAYLDMGEPDMAVPLLEEVQAQGNDGQKKEAASLLDRAR